VSRNEQRKESLVVDEVDGEGGESVCEREGGKSATRINKEGKAATIAPEKRK
jgi:hypothetical protein